MENWRHDYDELKDYINSHPTIEISPVVMVMPDDVRPEFYRLFDRVRVAFVKEMYPALLAEAFPLSAAFNVARKETIARLNLKEVDVNPQLGLFLQDPADGLMRQLFEPLFGLLQGKIDLETFEQTSANLVETSAKTFSHQGYTQWAALSLIKLVTPDAAYIVVVPDETTEPDLFSAVTRPGWYTEEVPCLRVADKLPLDFSLHTPFLVPKVILHSAELNAFVAFSTAFHEVYRKAKELNKHREWHSIEDIRSKFGMGDLWPDIVLALADSAEDLSITVDYFNVARPDVIVDVMDRADWYETGAMERIRRHHDVLKPRLGTFVVCRHPVPGAAVEELKPLTRMVQAAPPVTEGTILPVPVSNSVPAASAGEPCDDIHLLSVGYDAGALRPIVEAMLNSRIVNN